MKKEIGSIFPLADETIRLAESEQISFTGDRLYYSLCREALFNIAVSIQTQNKTVLIPAYTCQTVITPFEEAGWKCAYYSIHKDLRIDTQSLIDTISINHPSLIVIHPYFGMDLNDEETKTLQEINNSGIKIVLDLTQCIFSNKMYSFASYTVASYRKWFPIPDGGYLRTNDTSKEIQQPIAENPDFTEREIAAMYLRGQYFTYGEQRTKDISIRLSKAADQIAESNITPHKMSQVAYNLLQKEDFEENQRRRFDNYKYLLSNIEESNRITKVCKDIDAVTCAPLYFTIYVQDRPSLQRLLAQDSIYAPVIWPVEDERVLINEDVKYIYNHILAIPCDQRYYEQDMRRVVKIINRY